MTPRVIEQGGGGAGRGAGAEEGPRDAFYFAKRGLVDEVSWWQNLID